MLPPLSLPTTYFGPVIAPARKSIEDSWILPVLPPCHVQSTYFGNIVAPECACCVKMLPQSWELHEVLGEWMREEAFTYLISAVEMLNDVANGSMYTGAVANDSNGCHHWTHYTLEKRSLVWAFTHGISLHNLVIHHILGWRGDLTPK